VGTGGAASGGGGSSSTGGSGGTVASITGLTIEPNPNNTLSCFVSWTTDVPASSAVQFGVGSYEWEISDDALVTEHQVLVIGMHAEETYSIKAVSGGQSAEGMFTTGALPAQIPVGSVTIRDEALSQPGWTLMNMQKVNATQGSGVVIPNSPNPPAAVMYDEEGLPVWYHINGTTPDNGGAISTQLTDVGVLIGPSWNGQQTNGEPPREVDFAGNVVWECTHAACLPGESVSHHAEKLSNGHYVVLEDVADADGLKAPVFHELDENSQEVWSLDYADFVPPPDGVSGDWCHGNSITVDIENDAVYANCRWMGLLKTSYQNPTYQWLLPASCASMGEGDVTFTGNQIIDTHDPEIHADDDTILFFDNGGWTTRCPMSDYRSRVIEYQLDQASPPHATVVWEFPGSFAVPDTWYDDFYLAYWGDVDRLQNGNVLVTAGILSGTVESRVFEVTKADGVVVWEFRLPNFYGMYRAERIVPPLVHAIEP